MKNDDYYVRVPERKIDVVDSGQQPRIGWSTLSLQNIRFTTVALQSFYLARWEPVLHDALVVAAAIEFADRTVIRPSRGWARRLALRIPVHEPNRWNTPNLAAALHDAVGFLTGDFWSIEFVQRMAAAEVPSDSYLDLGIRSEAVLAYSDGMDSMAVAGITRMTHGNGLVCVRVGPVSSRGKSQISPFMAVPYTIKMSRSNKEASARNRGFKFALISGVAAYLAGTEKIIIPESGQGVIGPALVPVGHTYPDYRNHPLFTRRMERFLEALLGTPIRFNFPRIWNTKGETLRAYAAEKGSDWRSTKSCWRGSRWSAVNGTLRQCGACAACMLRRMSVHAAGLDEKPNTYVCDNLSAETIAAAIDPHFTRWSSAFSEYALAGVLHLDHLADMAVDDARSAVVRHAALLGPALGITPARATEELTSLLSRHATEWKEYRRFLGTRSFVSKWTRNEQ